MYKCEQCSSTFTRKDNLRRHKNKHDGIRFTCTMCPTTFSFKTNRNKHLKNIHGVVNVITHQPAPLTFVPDTPAGSSNQNRIITSLRANQQCEDDGSDKICLATLEEYENLADTMQGIDNRVPAHCKYNKIEEAPQVNVPVVSDSQAETDTDNCSSSDNFCSTALDKFENTDLNYTAQDSRTTRVNGEMTLVANTSKTKKDNSPASYQPIAVDSKNLHKGVSNDTTKNQAFLTPKNKLTLRGLYKEYLEVDNSNDKMMDWASHAGSLSRQLNLDFTVLAMFMNDNVIDCSIPIDKEILQMLHQDSSFSIEKIQQHTQQYIFMQIVYAINKIKNINLKDLNNYEKKNWMKNTITILTHFNCSGDTADFMIERITNST